MVSKREVRRIFNIVASERQLPDSTMKEFAYRAKSLLEIYASMCESQAGGPDSNKRLTETDVKLAFLKMEDLLTRPTWDKKVEEQPQEREEEEEEEEFGEWNNELE